MAFKLGFWNLSSNSQCGRSRSSQSDAKDQHESFPVRVVTVLGLVQVLVAVLIVALGVLALREGATMSNVGSGMWCGAIILISGIWGIICGQKTTKSTIIIMFVSEILSMAVSCLLIIFTASGLARDLKPQTNYYDEFDQENGSEAFEARRPVIVNILLLALGTTQVLLSIVCIFICLRDICMCYPPSWHKVSSLPNWNLLTADTSPEGQARAYRLLRWLGQQYPQPAPTRVATPMISVISPPMPYPTYVVPPMVPSMIPAMFAPSGFSPYDPFYQFGLPSLNASSLSQVNCSTSDEDQKRKERRRRRNSKSRKQKHIPEDHPESSSVQGDGSDREVEEEFIYHSMEPCIKSNSDI